MISRALPLGMDLLKFSKLEVSYVIILVGLSFVDGVL